VAEALANSAELRSLEARIEAAEAMVGPAGALPDPMLSVGASLLASKGVAAFLRNPCRAALRAVSSREVY